MTARVACLILCCCLAAQAESRVRVQLTAANEYVYRGIVQIENGSAYQALFEYQTEWGGYAGAWVSRVDSQFDDREWERDYFVGYQKRLTDRLALDFTLVRYTYDGEHRGVDYDWTELQATAHLFDGWSLMLAAGKNWWGSDERTYVAEATYRHPLPGGIVVDLTAGYQHADRAIDENYRYGEAGLSRSFGPLSARVAFATSGGVDRLDPLAPSRWIVSVSWQHDSAGVR